MGSALGAGSRRHRECPRGVPGAGRVALGERMEWKQRAETSGLARLAFSYLADVMTE